MGKHGKGKHSDGSKKPERRKNRGKGYIPSGRRRSRNENEENGSDTPTQRDKYSHVDYNSPRSPPNSFQRKYHSSRRSNSPACRSPYSSPPGSSKSSRKRCHSHKKANSRVAKKLELLDDFEYDDNSGNMRFYQDHSLTAVSKSQAKAKARAEARKLDKKEAKKAVRLQRRRARSLSMELYKDDVVVHRAGAFHRLPNEMLLYIIANSGLISADIGCLEGTCSFWRKTVFTPTNRCLTEEGAAVLVAKLQMERYSHVQRDHRMVPWRKESWKLLLARESNPSLYVLGGWNEEMGNLSSVEKYDGNTEKIDDVIQFMSMNNTNHFSLAWNLNDSFNDSFEDIASLTNQKETRENEIQSTENTVDEIENLVSECSISIETQDNSSINSNVQIEKNNNDEKNAKNNGKGMVSEEVDKDSCIDDDSFFQYLCVDQNSEKNKKKNTEKEKNYNGDSTIMELNTKDDSTSKKYISKSLDKPTVNTKQIIVKNGIPMNQSRRNFGAIVIGGKLFVVGGECNDETLASVECYNCKPSFRKGVCISDGNDGRWCNVAPMKSARCYLAVAAAGQRIYITGGLSSVLQPIVTVERYHIRKANWKEIAVMSTPRYSHATVIVGRCLYVIAGNSSHNIPLASVDKLDLPTGVWSTHPSLNVCSGRVQAVVWRGFIVVIDGWQNVEAFPICENPSFQLRKDAVPLGNPRGPRSLVLSTHMNQNAIWEQLPQAGDSISLQEVASAPLPPPLTISLSGIQTSTKESPTDESSPYVELFPNAWQEWPRLSVKRSKFGLAVWNDRLMVVGGFDDFGSCLNTVEQFCPVLQRWIDQVGFVTARDALVATS